MSERQANQANDANTGVVKRNACLPGIECTTRERALFKVKRSVVLKCACIKKRKTCFFSPNV